MAHEDNARRARWVAGLLLVIGAGVALWSVQPEPAPEPKPLDPPNIVLITFCTSRADRLGCYGYEAADTPNFDRLAGEGVVFENHYTQASFSGGSFASILTGRYCFGHGVFDHPHELESKNVTLAELLKSAGYRTAGFVTHLFVAPRLQFGQGFDTFERRAKPRRVAEQAVDWIDRQAQGPFFLWFQIQPSHYPYRGPAYLIRADARPVDATINQHPQRDRSRLMFEFDSFCYSESQMASVLALYDATVSHCDRLTGLILDALERRGELDKTLVMVTADHGDLHGEHDIYFNHAANLYEPTVRVPLIVRLPRSQHAGLRIADVTRNIDLLPSLAESAGVTVPDTVDGQSLWPVIDGIAPPRDAFAESGVFRSSRVGLTHYRQYLPGTEGKWRMLRRGPYKLIAIPGEGTGRGFAYELYDLRADPAETHNLSESLPKVRVELAESLARWFQGYQRLKVSPQELNPQDVEDLKSLGYID